MSAQAEARVRRALESLSIASTTAAEADEEDDDRARDLLAEAKKLGIHAHEGCVLVELPPHPAAGL